VRWFQGEFAIKLEIEGCQQTDKGTYKLVAKNDKGEATSQSVEVVDIPLEEEVGGVFVTLIFLELMTHFMSHPLNVVVT
jgi:hypothetical protein